MESAAELWLAYKLRWRRRRYLARAWRKRKELHAVIDNTASIRSGDILAFSTVRNEVARLPFFLDHHRALGVDHFFFVDNGSDDGSADLLRDQPDISLWRTEESYRAARFGVDWLNRLQHLWAPGHWALTLDADEILVFPGCESQSLQELTAWLDRQGIQSFGAMMLDMYPNASVSELTYVPGDPIWSILTHFDAHGYTWESQSKFRNISIRGGPRKRMFFSETPEYAPHLHKVPLVKWRRGYAYASSTHLVLPRRLNAAFDARRNAPTGVLLHSKFLPEIAAKSALEHLRGEHFTHSERYDRYYQKLAEGPNLMGEPSVEYVGPAQLEDLGLMWRGAWTG
ncbi:MAG: glycosyltransferase family 2 protein [Pseudomonadota bacterium]